MDIFTFLGLIILGVFFIFIGWRHKELVGEQNKLEQSEEDDFESKRIDLKRLISTLFTVIGAGEYALAITFVVIYGFWGNSFLIGLAVALLLISFFIPKIWIIKKRIAHSLPTFDGYRSLTTPDYVYYKYGRLCSITATGITALAFFALLVFQFVYGGILLNTLSNAHLYISTGFMMLIILLYTLMGGFAAIFYTDYWQKIFMWFGLFAALLFFYFLNENVVESENTITLFWNKTSDSLRFSNLLNDPNIIILFIITVAAAFGGPDLWQRANLAHSKSQAKKGLRIAALAMIIFAVVISFFSIDVFRIIPIMESQGLNVDDPFKAYITFVSTTSVSQYLWPQWLIFIFSIGLVSAFVSTADTSLMLVVSSIENEINRKIDFTNGKSTEVNRIRKNTSIIIISLLTFSFAIISPDIAQTFTAVLGILGVMGIPVFFSFFNIGNKTTCFLAMFLGIIGVVLANYFLPQKYNDGYYLLIPFVPGLLSLSTLISKQKRA